MRPCSEHLAYICRRMVPPFQMILYNLDVMINQVKDQTTVAVELDVFWKALAEDLVTILPKMIPHLIKDASIIEGNGSLGTVYLFNFGPDMKTMTYQKERISELDVSQHKITLDVIEGGHLNRGFTCYKTTTQLTAAGEGKTLVDVTVTYDSEIEDSTLPLKTSSSTLGFIKSLENYLINSTA